MNVLLARFVENLWDAKGGTFGVTGILETGEANHRKKRLIYESTAFSLEGDLLNGLLNR